MWKEKTRSPSQKPVQYLAFSMVVLSCSVVTICQAVPDVRAASSVSSEDRIRDANVQLFYYAYLTPVSWPNEMKANSSS